MAVTRLVAPGPEVAIATPTLLARRGVALCRVAGALLVAHQDVADRRRRHERVVERDDRAAGEAEDVGDAEEFEAAQDRAGARDHLGPVVAGGPAAVGVRPGMARGEIPWT